MYDAVCRNELADDLEEIRPRFIVERMKQLVATQRQLRVDELLGGLSLGDGFGEEGGDFAIDRRRHTLELAGHALGRHLPRERVGHRLEHPLLDELRDLLLDEALLGEGELAIHVAERRQQEDDRQHLLLRDCRIRAEHRHASGCYWRNRTSW